MKNYDAEQVHSIIKQQRKMTFSLTLLVILILIFSVTIEKIGAESEVLPNNFFDTKKDLPLFEIPQALLEASMSKAGFSPKGARIMAAEKGGELLSIDDMPKALATDLKQALEELNRKGFSEISEKEIKEITEIKDHLISSDYKIPNIKFQLSKLPPSISKSYQYLGYTFPSYTSRPYFATKAQQNTVLRVFQKLNSNDILVIEEASTTVGSVQLMKAFVNVQVDGLPAIHEVKKSKSNISYTMINWMTPRFIYTLYAVGALEKSKQGLVNIADDLSKANH